MARIIVELTNRCNLRCLHCYDERHAATGDISMNIVDKVLEHGHDCGIEHLAFTGGEPTLHFSFAEIVHRICESGYSYSFVSNGINFSKVYRILLKYRSEFKGLTFSLDGAREETHDNIRGKGSYRRLMSAVSLCVFNQLPFTFNMVVTATNRGQIAEMVRLSEKLGSQGIRFGFLMFSQETAQAGLDLSPQESREVQGRQILGFIHVRATSTGVPQSIRSRLRHLLRGKVAHPHGPIKPFVLGIIEDCFVNFGSRHQGIGTSLLDRAMTWFHENGMERVELAVLANNKDGEKFWVKHGFRTYRLLMSKQSP